MSLYAVNVTHRCSTFICMASADYKPIFYMYIPVSMHF